MSEIEEIPEIRLNEWLGYFFFPIGDRAKAGICLCHLTENGEMCVSNFPFDFPDVRAAMVNPELSLWKLDKEEPLTLTPSLICKGCGLHGYLKEGMWAPLPRWVPEE